MVFTSYDRASASGWKELGQRGNNKMAKVNSTASKTPLKFLIPYAASKNVAANLSQAVRDRSILPK
ncbi:hypothetical protein [Henriciella marina]|uniref:hypothetical protein n=1 Tax=Henriciella marina TaxID=453851 RepID=UPI0003685C10|nr:hypothetical protein [Henriciella marina]